MKSDIDFVVMWVDGNDPEWLKKKEQYSREYENSYDDQSGSINRFRDWDNMKYWFRAVEKFAPWVRKIHFVTYGHLPDFLDVSHPKLNVVNHSDYMPSDCLPCFNSTALEINLHCIEDLSEQFVFFNDDMFLLNPVEPTYYFKKGLPCLEGLQATVHTIGDGNSYYHHLLNDVDVINRHFNKRVQMKKHPFKWFHPIYGLEASRNVLLLPWQFFTGFKNSHGSTPFLKSTFKEVWDAESERLNMTSHSRFRTFYNLNQYVFRYWQLAKGDFIPHKPNVKFCVIRDDNYLEISSIIRKQMCQEICINDSIDSIQFELCKKEINNAFESILPDKSSFEL